MSFSQDLSALNDDDFEGSNNEILISQEVFYGIDSPAGGEKHELNGFINFGCQQHKFVGSSPSSNTGSVTSEASSKGSCLKDGNNVHGASLRTSPSASFTEGFLLAERKDHAVPAKRMKLSVDELSSFKPLLQKALASEIPLKKIVSGVHHPKFCLDCQIVMSHVVESSSEGVRSSCYLLKQGFETERKGCLGDRGLPTDNLLGSEGSEGKEIVVSNAIASPVSQESCATKILVAAPAGANVDETGSRQRAVRKRKKGTPVELDEDHTPWTSDCTKELRPLLRRQIFHLLAAAGWSIEKRKRQCRTYEEFVFISPEERPVRELSKAWSLCGQFLLAHEYKQMQAQDGRQWTNIDEFCSDLSSTLTNMDNELKHPEPKATLARQWVLLDPFVTVVFVDRKIKDLRAGNVVKAKHNSIDTCEKSVVVGKGKRSDVRCTMKKFCDSSLASESTVIDFSRQSQGGEVEASMSRSIYVSEGNCMRLLETVNKMGGNPTDLCMDDSRHQCSPSMPAFGSGITCLQPASYLYDVPAESGNRDLTDGVSKKFSAHQDDASDIVMHGPRQLCAEDAKHRWCFDSSSLRNSGTDGCLDSNSKGKLPKKSKISEIELTSFSEDQILNMSTPCRVEDDVRKMNDYTKKANDKSFKKMPSNTKAYRKKTPKVKSLPCQLKDDDLLISAIVRKKGFRSNSSNCNVKPGAKLRPLKKRKNHKRGCRLLPRNLGKGGKHFPDGRWSLVAERTVLSWLINTSVIFPNEIIQYRDSKDETVVKDGLITRDGILCKCCNKVFSVSEFKVHAGLEMNRLCLNLFTDSDQPFTLRLLEAWSAEYKARKAGLRAVQSDEFDQNDDSCGLCGDGGELLCCDNCPSTFHQSCLSAEELPEGSWYCASCTCWICGNLVDDEASSAHCGFRCCQCEHKYHVVCLTELGVDRTISNPWFCSGSCEEVHSGLQSRVGLCNLTADGFSWSVLRCIDDDQKVHTAQRFALKAECNSKLVVALTIMEECFVSMVDARTGIDMIPQVLYNWGSEFPRLDYHGFYTVVLEKNDVLISVASIRVHGVKVAEMPLVATCSKYRRKGMCRRLLNAVEQMLISLKVQMLVITAIPHLVETWTVGFGFVPVEEEEKKSLNKINLMVFPGTVMLKKALYSGQTADLQGAGSAAGVSSVGMDKSIEEGASSREQCGSERENDDRCGSDDLGGLNVKLGSLHDKEVVVAQSRVSQRSESRDTDKAVSGGCMSLPVCGHTEASDCCDVLPHRETGKAVQDMLRQAGYDDVIAADKCGKQGGLASSVATGVIGNNTNCLLPQECSDSNENKLEMSFNVVDEVGSKAFNCSVPQELAGMRTKHEEIFGVENEIESEIATCPVLQEGADHGRKPLEVASNVGFENIENCPFSQSAEPGRMNAEACSNVVAEVEVKITNPPVRHEGTDRQKALYGTITSGDGNERECRKTDLPLSQEGADLEETRQVAAVAPNEADQVVIEQEAAIIDVSKAENKNNFLVLPGDEVHSVEADELPGTCINCKADELGTIKEADIETEKASQEVHASEPGQRLETEPTVELELLEASSENNSFDPCSSAALEAQNGCASDIETQFDTRNKLFLMEKLKRLVFWQNHSNTNR